MSTTQHPLTETAVAEPTNAMVLAALNAYHREQYRSWGRVDPETGEVLWEDRASLDEFADGVVKRVRATLTAALEVAPNKDTRPWGPLAEGDTLHVGDEVKQERDGLTITAVVALVDVDGYAWTSKGGCVGSADEGTWYVRRSVPELPTEDGAVIVPAEGHEYIETNEGAANALAHLGGKWYGGAFQIKPEQITPGTWKVADQ